MLFPRLTRDRADGQRPHGQPRTLKPRSARGAPGFQRYQTGCGYDRRRRRVAPRPTKPTPSRAIEAGSGTLGGGGAGGGLTPVAVSAADHEAERALVQPTDADVPAQLPV